MPHKDPEARRTYLAAYNARNQERQRPIRLKWATEHADNVRAYKQRYHAKRLATDLAGVRATTRRQELARLYKITPEDYEVLAAAQHNRCAICGAAPSAGKRLHVDHNHASGAVRGLLCGHCNRAIGLFREDPNLLALAAAYLLRFGS